MAVIDRFFGQIGVDRRRADADQHGEVMHVQAFRATHVDRGDRCAVLRGPNACARRRSQDHRHRCRSLELHVGQESSASCPRAPRLRHRADSLERRGQLHRACWIEGAVDFGSAYRPCKRRIGLERGVGQHGAFQIAAASHGGALRSKMLPRLPRRVLSDITRAFAQLIDRRVGHLAEGSGGRSGACRGTDRDSTATGASSPIDPIGFLAASRSSAAGSSPYLPCVSPKQC